MEEHRFSLRLDIFDVTQNDRTPEDNNPENGHAWTFAWQYAWSDTASLGAEWLSIDTHHCGWAYFGLEPDATEQQLQLSVRMRFGN